MAFSIADTATAIALRAHHGHVNKHDGEPYILHVHRVASNFGSDTIEDELRQAVAWLHDAVEDTDYTLDDIWRDFSKFGASIAGRIHDGVRAITKHAGGHETNEEYYERVARNDIARDVKIRDILDNFGRNHMIEDDATRDRMAAKYSLGLDRLCRQR